MNNLLLKCSRDEFTAQSFSDYIDSVNSRYSEFMSLVQDIINYDYDDEQKEFASWFQEKLSEYRMSGSMSITLNGGYTTLDALADFLHNSAENYAESGDVSELVGNPGLQLTKIGGSLGELVSFTDVIDSIRSSLHSSVVAGAACLASFADSAADRLTIFNDKVSSIFANAYDDVSSTASFFRSQLATAECNASSILASLFSSSGAEKAEEDENFIPANSALYEYTGATPVAALDFSTAAKAVQATAKVVGKAVAGLFKFAIGAMKKVFTKVGNKLVQLTTNPFDISLLDGGAKSYLVDGFQLQYVNNDTTHVAMGDVYDDTTDDVFFNSTFVSDHYSNKWIKIDTIFGEILVKFKSIWTQLDGLAGYKDVVFKFKPRCINYESIKTPLGGITYIDGSPDYPNIFTFSINESSVNPVEEFGNLLESMKHKTDLYLDITDTNEREMCYGFMHGSVFSWLVIHYMTRNMLTTSHDFYGYLNSHEITNADFITRVSGWDQNASNPSFDFSKMCGSSAVSSATFVEDIVRFIVLHAKDRYMNPLSYMFIPYRNNVADFSAPRFSIKTDSQNQKALTTFLTTAVAVIITVAAATFIGLKIKKHQRNKFFKRAQKRGVLDQKMWNGGKLTAAEQRQYIKASRKLNASALLGSGLISSASNTASSLCSNAADVITSTLYSQTDTGLSDLQSNVNSDLISVQNKVIENLNMQVNGLNKALDVALQGLREDFSTRVSSLEALIKG